MLILISIALATGLSYSILILFFLKGWNGTHFVNNTTVQRKIKVSVVIAIRNEAPNIPDLTRALIKQDYPKNRLEILFIDDHSTDSSKEIIELCMKGEDHYSILESSGNGKKDALISGYNFAGGELIITTDADCKFGKKWISTIVSYYENSGTEFIMGPVILDEGPGIFQDLQALEFLSLTGTSGGSAGIGRPVLCNGANLAFNKNRMDFSPQTIHPQFASGDDIFLLHTVKKIPGVKSGFLKSRSAISLPATTRSSSRFSHVIMSI